MRPPLTAVFLSSAFGEIILAVPDRTPSGSISIRRLRVLPSGWCLNLAFGSALLLISHSGGCRQGKVVHSRLRPEHLAHHSADYHQGWVVDQGRQVAGDPQLQEP